MCVCVSVCVCAYVFIISVDCANRLTNEKTSVSERLIVCVCVCIGVNMSMQTQDGDGQCEVEWWFGEGMSYTSFQYTALEVEPKTIHDGQLFRVGQACQHTCLVLLYILNTECTSA